MGISKGWWWITIKLYRFPLNKLTIQESPEISQASWKFAELRCGGVWERRGGGDSSIRIIWWLGLCCCRPGVSWICCGLLELKRVLWVGKGASKRKMLRMWKECVKLFCYWFWMLMPDSGLFSSTSNLCFKQPSPAIRNCTGFDAERWPDCPKKPSLW